ncbi:MAG: 2-phospho-L-lactate guanylyltransferase [Myxococcota bacterium]|nr:2-phospho-L-lactate guanylyltransferase [Myxococcota bacterium]
MIHAVVPVKRLEASKSRMLPNLSSQDRDALSLAMLEDVVAALTAAKRVDRIAVVTPDSSVAKIAENAGAKAILFLEEGLNKALDAAAAELAPAPGDGLLVILGDVAGALATDIDTLCEALDDIAAPGIALAPARDGGSAALLRRPHDAIAAQFGHDSGRIHRDAAVEAGVTCCELELASLSIDLDDADDLERFLSLRAGGTRTRALLESLGWDG